MMNFIVKPESEVFKMSAAQLAFVGDAVYELCVRERLALEHDGDIGYINNLKVKLVCCTAQAQFLEKIVDILTEREMMIYKRGRNAHIGNVPKKIAPAVYHSATGLEALFGYLYLSGKLNRIKQLMNELALL